jgi:hypothetical protein
MAICAIRVNSSCVEQERSSFTGEQTATGGVHTFAIPAHTWAVQACGDRLGYILQIRSTASMGGNDAVTIETGTTDAECIANITEDTGGCVGAVDPPFKQFDYQPFLAR